LTAVATQVDDHYVAAGRPEPPSVDATEDDAAAREVLFETWRKVRALEAQLETDRERLEAERTRIDADRSEVEGLLTSAREEHENAEARTKVLEEREEQISAMDTALLAREEVIAAREAGAESGFLEQRRASLQAFYDEKRRLLSEAGEIQAELFKQQQEVPRILKERLDELSSEQSRELDAQRQLLEAQRAELAGERDECAAERAELQRQRVALVARELNVSEDEEFIGARAEAKAGELLEAERLRADQLERRVVAMTRNLTALEQQLDDVRRANDRFSGRSPADVLHDVERRQAENEALREQLANALSGEAVLRLRQLEAERQTWEDDRLALVRDAQEARAMLERARTATGELEVARDTVRSLEVRAAAYRDALATQRADWEQLVEQGRASAPFPECSWMDEDPTLQKLPARLVNPETLVALAEDVRNRMAAQPGRSARYYALNDVRVFLAGLAMSRLHLLEGISGTGKTSLPLSFALAIGGGKRVIEVQAGWRDRDDLLGHFNSFEGKFYEKEMTQALYEAQCPAFSTRPYFIVLDEMNLSHPEQYFADFLSELELPAAERRVALRTERTASAPRLFEDGRYLRIPPNVWFIGTANHDETTVGFADKTYDRAHVMQLPHHHKEFKPPRLRSAQPVGNEGLQGLFDAAVDDFGDDAELAHVYLTSDVGEVLRSRFGVGWGNRLVNQVKLFVPVILAAGGDIGEATDHLLATKLLRKVRDRHDLLPEDFEALRKALESSWPTLGPRAGDPVKSREVLDREVRRLGGGPH
jgi:hypothetical protein